MFLLHRPSTREVDAFLAAARQQPLSYDSHVLRDAGAGGFTVDELTAAIGNGRGAFDSARRALTRWTQSNLGWMCVFPQDAPIKVGEVVAVLVRHLGFWSMNGCRVTAVIDRDPHTFGFVYGTLADHAECGEEGFLVSFDSATGAVSYSIRAISKPRAPLARLGWPYARRLQARFRRDSVEAMKASVTGRPT